MAWPTGRRFRESSLAVIPGINIPLVQMSGPISRRRICVRLAFIGAGVDECVILLSPFRSHTDEHVNAGRLLVPHFNQALSNAIP